MIDRGAKKSFTMWILKRYYLIDGINQLFAVIYLYLFILEYHFFFRFIPLYANMSRYFYIMGTYIKFAILLIAKLNE